MEDDRKENDLHTESDLVPEEDADIFEEVDEEGREASSASKQKQLRAKLSTCEEEKRKLLEDLQRAKADFLNSKRRLEEQLGRDRERIVERHILELLPLADSFDMAMADPAWNDHDEAWRRGVEGIHGQLQNILRGYNVTPVGSAGEAFDPMIHEAVSHEGDGDRVVRVLQKGYRISDRVLRPARVVVGTQ